MAWIKVRTELHESPTVVRIVTRLCRANSATNVARPVVTNVVVGGLVRLWSLADTHTTDGILVGYTPEIIDGMIGMDGFCEAVAAEEWMHIEPQAIVIPEFEKHNGESAKKRAMNTQRQKECRANRATDVAPKLLPEKRREEKRRIENTPLPPKGGGVCANGDVAMLPQPDPFAPVHDDDIGSGVGSVACARIYAAYPVQAKRESSIRATAAAVARVRERGQIDPAGWLLSRVEAFAKSAMGKPGNRYCPACDKWMDDGRYDDDDRVWNPVDKDDPVAFMDTPEFRRQCEEAAAEINASREREAKRKAQVKPCVMPAKVTAPTKSRPPA